MLKFNLLSSNDIIVAEDAVARQSIRDALQGIEDVSCVRFNEFVPPTTVEQNHVMFTYGSR